MAAFVRLWVCLLGWVGFYTACQPIMIDYKGHRVFNPEYLPYLESQGREDWQKPGQIIAALELSKEAVVADIGAGGGYFTERFSRYLEPAGYVYATDVQERMMRRLRERVIKRGMRNVEVIRGKFDHPMLPPHCCDLVFFSSVYKEIDDRVDYMRRIKKVLKSGGRVALIEYKPAVWNLGPPMDMRLPQEQVIREMADAGFEVIQRYDFLPREYFLIFAVVGDVR